MPAGNGLPKLGLPAPFDGNVPQGSGTLIWLEFGRVVHWKARGADERPVGIIRQTNLLWHKARS